MLKKQGELSHDNIKSLVYEFAVKVKRFKKVKASFEESKESFEGLLGKFLEAEGSDAFRFEYPETELGDGVAVTVSRQQRVSIVFDADKVDAIAKRKIAGHGHLIVVDKTYEVSDIGGLVAYLKGIGADPAIVKSFLNVRKSVRQEGLDQAESLGVITREDLKGCYTVNKSKPFFKLKFDKLQGEG